MQTGTGNTQHFRPVLHGWQLAMFRILGVVMVALCAAGIGWAQQQSTEYRLGPEDVINIVVMNHPEMSGEFLVPNDGVVNTPRAGQMNVVGKTLADVADMVRTGLNTTLRDPEVTVTLRTPRRQLVYIMGAVRSPGPADMKPGWRTMEAISAAGGLVPGVEPADCTVTILRAADGKRDLIPYQEITRGDSSKNQPLHAGDVITLEAVESIPVYVMGKVNRPGVYNIRKDSAGVLEALTMAGGTTDDAALTKVTVTHLSGESETANILPVTLNGKQESPIKLRSGDMVVVPDSIARFAVLGWVGSPGFFPLKENQKVSLTDAIGMAKGTDNRRGGLSNIAVLRTVNGKQQRLVFDLTKFAKKGDATQNPEVQPGDVIWVPETNKLDWERLLSGLTSGLSLIWTVDRLGSR